MRRLFLLAALWATPLAAQTISAPGASAPTESAANTVKGNNAGSSGPTVDLSPTQARAVLGLGTAALANTGSSGATIPLLNVANTWGATQAANISGNASTATALVAARTISISGDLSFTSPAFDGSSNVTATGTLAAVNGNVGSFGSATLVPVLTIDAKGRVTAASTAAVSAGAPVSSYLGTTADSGTTITSGNVVRMLVLKGTWAANRTTVLSSGVPQGYVIHIANNTSGGFSSPVRNLTAGGTTLVTVGPGKWAILAYDSGNWELVGSGASTTTP